MKPSLGMAAAVSYDHSRILPSCPHALGTMLLPMSLSVCVPSQRGMLSAADFIPVGDGVKDCAAAINRQAARS